MPMEWSAVEIMSDDITDDFNDEKETQNSRLAESTRQLMNAFYE